MNTLTRTTDVTTMSEEEIQAEQNELADRRNNREDLRDKGKRSAYPNGTPWERELEQDDEARDEALSIELDRRHPQR